MLATWRAKLKEQNSLLEERFSWNDLEVKDDCINYKNITAGKIIFAKVLQALIILTSKTFLIQE
jgi:hypothetical protein